MSIIAVYLFMGDTVYIAVSHDLTMMDIILVRGLSILRNHFIVIITSYDTSLVLQLVVNKRLVTCKLISQIISTES